MKAFGSSVETDVAIDKYALDSECEVNPSAMQHYGELLAQAKTKRDDLKTALKLITAETSLTVRRSDPAVYGVQKYTEDVISSLVTCDPKVKAAEEEYNAANEDVYVYEAAMDSVRSKDGQLKTLASLWAAGYYAKGN